MSETWDDEEDGRNGIFAVMWDCYGLEAIARLPDPADRTFALLRGDKPPEMPAINHWALRARFNPQRNYEIYIITAAPGIEESDIVQMFENNPQVAADTIRRIGQRFWGHRDTKERVIT
jgi:hypothetical protein